MRLNHPTASSASGDSRAGFTLLEVLAALAVMGVAISIFVGLYRVSLVLADTSRSQIVAAQLAEELVANVLTDPEQYEWPYYDADSTGKRQPLIKRSDSGHVSKAAPPAAMPTTERAYRRVRNFYQDFTREVYARLPEADAKYVEVVVVIRWMEEGRERLFSLTSAVPRSVGEGLA